jgi:hypothetical protein
MQQSRIKKFGGLNVIQDSSDAPGLSLSEAENVLLRPAGALRRMPSFKRAWGLNNLRLHLGGLGVTSADGVVMLSVQANEMRSLVALDVTGYPAAVKTLGAYFLGDSEGLLSASSPQVPDPMVDVSGQVVIEVLRKGLASGRRWFFSRIYREVWMGNGVDDNMIYSQTRTPRLRSAGTNQRPAVPIASESPTPPPVPSVPAKYEASLAGGVDLRILADQYNFPGEDGQNLQFGILTHAGDTVEIANVQASRTLGLNGASLVLEADIAYPGTSGHNIQVALANNPANVLNVNATRLFTTSGDQVTWSALIPGTAGNNIRVAYLPNPSNVAPVANVQATLFVTNGSGGSFTVQAASAIAGTAGNNIRFRIVLSGLDQPISSTLTGSGTAGNPYIYTVLTGSEVGQRSMTDVVSYVNTDPLRVNILAVPAGVGGSNPNTDATGVDAFLAGGVDAVAEVSIPLTSTISGAGTAGSPYDYVVYHGRTAPHSSFNALRTFVNADANAAGIVSILPGSGPGAPLPEALYPLQSLLGGVSEVSMPISSMLSGAGTVASPFVYTLIRGVSASDSSQVALGNYVNQDPLRQGILTAVNIGGSSSLANPTVEFFTAALTGGVDFVPEQSTPIASERSGAGTVTSPFVYVIRLGVRPEHSSASAIKQFVNADPNALGVFRAELTAESDVANVGLTQPVGALSGGVDEVPLGGQPIYMRAAFAASFYDPGIFGENTGYEGPASFVSAELTGNGANDFLVTVQGDTAGENARFTQINIWMRVDVGYPANAFGNPGPYEWIKVKTVPNQNGTYRIYRNFRKLEVTKEPPLEGRIPPCTMFEFAGQRVWAAGNDQEPYRVWLGKLATETENAPEGVNIRSYLDMGGRKEEPSRPKITALSRLETRVQVHTNSSVTMVDAFTLRRIVSRSDYGAINPSCLAPWSRPSIPYLGSDGVIYEMGNVQYYRSNEAGVTAWPLLREKADLAELIRRPARCNMLADPTNQIVVAWVPMKQGGELGAFVMDYTANAITGPHQYPKLLSGNPVSVADSRVFGCDEVGNLVVVDFGGLHETPLEPSPSFTLRDPGYVPPLSEEGFPRHFFADGRSLDRGIRLVWETQMLDMDMPDQRKGFYSLSWTVARYSRGIVTVVVRTDDGQEKRIELGEMYGRERNKVVFAVSGNAVVVRMEVVCGEDRPWVIRDVTLTWESQQNANPFMM